MNKCAPEAGESASIEPASLELRYAQRAFAALVDAYPRAGEFRVAQLRAAANRTLSAMSADDRARLAGWLSLQLAAADRRDEEIVLGLLARIDARLVARIRRELPHYVEALAIRAEASRIVAA